MLNKFIPPQIFEEKVLKNISKYTCSYSYGDGLITFAFSTNQIKNKKGNSQTTFNFIKNKANNYPFSFRIYDRFYKCRCVREPNYIISGELKLVNGDIKKHLAITTQNKITEDLLLTLIQKEIEEEENNA